MSSQSSECPLCKIPGKEPVVVFSSQGGEDFYIVRTKADKGHSYRYMVALFDHKTETALGEDAIAALFMFMRQVTRDFLILEPTNATVKDHWHRVACDSYAGNDFDLIEKTNRMEIRSLKAGETSES